jgi:hypothetical protein
LVVNWQDVLFNGYVSKKRETKLAIDKFSKENILRKVRG